MMTERGVCEVCGRSLPYGRRRYCCSECTKIGTGHAAEPTVSECRICGGVMRMRTRDGLCGTCRDLVLNRNESKTAMHTLENALRERDRRKDENVRAWRESSTCYRCVYARPLYDNVVFCNSTYGTCIADDQRQRLIDHMKKEGDNNGSDC